MHILRLHVYLHDTYRQADRQVCTCIYGMWIYWIRLIRMYGSMDGWTDGCIDRVYVLYVRAHEIGRFPVG